MAYPSCTWDLACCKCCWWWLTSIKEFGQVMCFAWHSCHAVTPDRVGVPVVLLRRCSGAFHVQPV
jgi:hypothetical protein